MNLVKSGVLVVVMALVGMVLPMKVQAVTLDSQDLIIKTKCEWCGKICQRSAIREGVQCPDVMPPPGSVCVEEDGQCVSKDEVIAPTLTLPPKPTSSSGCPELKVPAGCSLKQPNCIQAPCCPIVICPDEASPIPVCNTCPKGYPSKQEGNADCDKDIDKDDLAAWKREFVLQRRVKTLTRLLPSVGSADFNCDNKLTIVDYAIWRLGFWKTRIVPVITSIPTVPRATLTPRPNPTVVINRCGTLCYRDLDCGGGEYICLIGGDPPVDNNTSVLGDETYLAALVPTTTRPKGVCRNKNCEYVSNCICPGPTTEVTRTPTSTLRPTATKTPVPTATRTPTASPTRSPIPTAYTIECSMTEPCAVGYVCKVGKCVLSGRSPTIILDY